MRPRKPARSRTLRSDLHLHDPTPKSARVTPVLGRTSTAAKRRRRSARVRDQPATQSAANLRTTIALTESHHKVGAPGVTEPDFGVG